MLLNAIDAGEIADYCGGGGGGGAEWDLEMTAARASNLGCCCCRFLIANRELGSSGTA